MSGRVCCEACSPFSSIHFSRWDFCAAGLFGSSASGISAPQGCLAAAPRDFLRRRVVWQQRLRIFCAAGLFGSSASGFSAPQGRSSRNSDFFLRRRVVRQKTVTFFCAGGSFVKKQRLFSAPEARSSKNGDFFLRRKLARQKTVTFFCAGGSGVRKQRLFLDDMGALMQRCRQAKRKTIGAKMLCCIFAPMSVCGLSARGDLPKLVVLYIVFETGIGQLRFNVLTFHVHIVAQFV